MFFEFVTENLKQQDGEQQFNHSEERSAEYKAYSQGMFDCARLAATGIVLYLICNHGAELLKK